MVYIERILKSKIQASIQAGKVILLYGARRVGKTILIKQIEKEYPGKCLIMNGEDNTSLRLLEDRSIANYRKITQGIDLLIIDEAHQIPDIGRKLKLMIDEIEGLCVIASGSSAHALLTQTVEPLTGRYIPFALYPLAQAELNPTASALETLENLDERLIYGSYPEVLQIKTLKEKEKYLQTIVNAYLYKDILSLEGVQKSGKINDLLRLIAFQVGQEASSEEIGRQLSLSKNTVEKYLDLLTRIYVLYPLKGFSRNLRKEVSRNNKWYFYDNGIRNALLGDFSPIVLRQDLGALWENYLLSERIKKASNNDEKVDFFFWRTYDQQEIDVIERQGNNLNAIEIKWKDKYAKAPQAWTKNYPEATWKLLNQNNYLEWIL